MNMVDERSNPEQRQIERAKRLRKRIETLKDGLPEDDQNEEPRDDEGKEHGKSLKEEIQEREAEQRKSTDTE
jgi:hypothetical protein